MSESTACVAEESSDRSSSPTFAFLPPPPLCAVVPHINAAAVVVAIILFPSFIFSLSAWSVSTTIVRLFSFHYCLRKTRCLDFIECRFFFFRITPRNRRNVHDARVLVAYQTCVYLHTRYDTYEYIHTRNMCLIPCPRDGPVTNREGKRRRISKEQCSIKTC